MINNHLENEITVYLVFSSMEPETLCKANPVCKLWNQIANDNVIWKNLFFKVFGKYADEYLKKYSMKETWKETFKVRSYIFIKSYPYSSKLIFGTQLTWDQVTGAAPTRHLSDGTWHPGYPKIEEKKNDKKV